MEIKSSPRGKPSDRMRVGLINKHEVAAQPIAKRAAHALRWMPRSLPLVAPACSTAPPPLCLRRSCVALLQMQLTVVRCPLLRN